MPLYMDVHKGVEELTAEAVVGAHEKDLEVQEKNFYISYCRSVPMFTKIKTSLFVAVIMTMLVVSGLALAAPPLPGSELKPSSGTQPCETEPDNGLEVTDLVVPPQSSAVETLTAGSPASDMSMVDIIPEPSLPVEAELSTWEQHQWQAVNSDETTGPVSSPNAWAELSMWELLHLIWPG